MCVDEFLRISSNMKCSHRINASEKIIPLMLSRKSLVCQSIEYHTQAFITDNRVLDHLAQPISRSENVVSDVVHYCVCAADDFLRICNHVGQRAGPG